jgi:hypothetical protein
MAKACKVARMGVGIRAGQGLAVRGEGSGLGMSLQIVLDNRENRDC